MTEPGWLTGLHDPEALPTLDETNRAYFAAAARGEFILQRCSAGHAILYPRLVCPVCHDDQREWEQTSGAVEVVSHAPVHRPPRRSFGRSRLCLVVLVRLDEGPPLMTTLERVAIEDARIGQRVHTALVRFVPG